MLRTTANLATLLLTTTLASSVHAEIKTQTVTYQIDAQPFEGTLVYDTAKPNLPGLLMVPNWMGPTPQSLEKAVEIAQSGYVVFMADMYGSSVRPKDADEAGKAAAAVRSDRPLMRKRAKAALDQLTGHASTTGMNLKQVGAIGFCFGGGTVLELARSGEPLSGVVSFHGNLDTPNPADAQNIKTSLLVLHGADDPYVPAEQVQGFESEMRTAKVDWQLVSYGGTVHSFTDKYATAKGQAEYNPQSAVRAFRAMNDFFSERFAATP
ncbi:MAG: dienelactone hydrolase family protein [Hahellaceae bacterium]|nr:dienelactone hydrolase family protein [Hahellaceae bacterium]